MKPSTEVNTVQVRSPSATESPRNFVAIQKPESLMWERETDPSPIARISSAASALRMAERPTPRAEASWRSRGRRVPGPGRRP